MTPTDAIAALNDLREIVRAGAMSGEADAVGICNGLIKHFQAELAHDPVCPAYGGTGVIREYIERPVNGQVEQRTDKRPGLGDLRESGAIEQDADLVAFIYRDDMYNKSDDNPRKGIAEIMIEKHRNGKTGTVELAYLEKYTRFENLATTTWEEGKEKRRQGQ